MSNSGFVSDLLYNILCKTKKTKQKSIIILNVSPEDFWFEQKKKKLKVRIHNIVIDNINTINEISTIDQVNSIYE